MKKKFEYTITGFRERNLGSPLVIWDRSLSHPALQAIQARN